MRADTMQVEKGEAVRPIYFAPGYFISNTGVVLSMLPLRNYAKPPTNPRELRLYKDKDGYRKVVLRVDGKRKYYRVPWLVARIWCEGYANGLVVRHLDGSKDNDFYMNLSWGTPKENAHDKYTHGTMRMGSQINTSRLSLSDVIYIRANNKKCSDLAEQFNVTIGTIYHIKNNRTWRYV